MDISIPQKRLASEKTFNEISSRFESMNSNRINESTASNQMGNQFNLSFDPEESKRLMIESKLDYEIWNLQEKIINRRTLKIIQILCQLTVNNGLDDETISWVANFIILHLKSNDVENINISLACIIDVLLFDKELSYSFLKIYESMLLISEVKPDNILDSNPLSSQSVTIIKAIFDTFCMLQTIGIDIFEFYYDKEGHEKIKESEDFSVDDVNRLKISNKLLSTIISKFLFWCNIHVRALWNEGLIKCMFEKRLGTFWNEHKSIIDPRILYNESLYATLILLSLLINKEVILGVKQSGENELAYKQMEERFQIMIRNYGTASKENFLHIFEAILFVFLNNIKNENYASRRRRKNKNLNKILFCLSNIREEDIIEYLIIMMHRKLCFDVILNI